MRPIIEQSIPLTGMQKQAAIMCGYFAKEDIGTGYDVIFSSSAVKTGSCKKSPFFLYWITVRNLMVFW